MTNLAERAEYAASMKMLKQQLTEELKRQKDPRMFGKGHVFDEYIYASPGTRKFYERFMKGEKLRAGWVNASDFEKKPLEE